MHWSCIQSVSHCCFWFASLFFWPTKWALPSSISQLWQFWKPDWVSKTLKNIWSFWTPRQHYLLQRNISWFFNIFILNDPKKLNFGRCKLILTRIGSNGVIPSNSPIKIGLDLSIFPHAHLVNIKNLHQPLSIYRMPKPWSGLKMVTQGKNERLKTVLSYYICR